MKFLIVVFTLILFQLKGLANILFIDINNNPEEVKIARAAAKKNNEKIVVYPEQKLEVQLKISALEQKLRSLRAQISKLPSNDPRYDSLIQERSSVIKGIKEIKESSKFSFEGLKKILGEADQNHTKFTSLVISGHDGNNSFTGTYGTLGTDDLGELFSEFPDQSGSIDSLFLAGCYTTTPGILDTQFKNYFPNLKIVAGYNDSAPLGDKPAGHSYILNFLTNRGKFSKYNDENKVMPLVRSIIPKELTSNASMCMTDGVYVKRNLFTTMKDAWEKCDDLNVKLVELLPIYQCYDQGDKGCENLPSNTHSSKLRDLYNLVQEMKPCVYKDGFQFSAVIDPEKLIRLIYFSKVKNNFSKLYDKNILELSEILKELGLTEKYVGALRNLKDLNRFETISAIEEIKKFVSTLDEEYRHGSSELDPRKVALLQSAVLPVYKIHDILTSIDTHCIPFSWVEDSDTESPCFKEEFGNQYFEARLESAEESVLSLKRQRIDYKYRDLLKEVSTTQDQVISDSAVASSIRSQVSARYELEKESLGYEYDKYRCKKHKNCTSEQIAEIEKKSKITELKIADMNPLANINLAELTNDREKFFKAAYELINVNDQEIHRIQERIQQLTSSLERQENEYDRNRLERLKIDLKNVSQRREYIALMHKQFEKGSFEDKDSEKIQEIFEDRIKEMRLDIQSKLIDEVMSTSKEYESCIEVCGPTELNGAKVKLDSARSKYIEYYMETQGNYGI